MAFSPRARLLDFAYLVNEVVKVISSDHLVTEHGLVHGFEDFTDLTDGLDGVGYSESWVFKDGVE